MTSPNWPISLNNNQVGFVWWETTDGKTTTWYATNGYNLIQNLDKRFLLWKSQISDANTVTNTRMDKLIEENPRWDAQTFDEIRLAGTAFVGSEFPSSFVNDINLGSLSPLEYSLIIWLAFYAPDHITTDVNQMVQATLPKNLLVPNQNVAVLFNSVASPSSDANALIHWDSSEALPASMQGTSWTGVGIPVGTVRLADGKTWPPATNAPGSLAPGIDATVAAAPPQQQPSASSHTTTYLLVGAGVLVAGGAAYALLRKK